MPNLTPCPPGTYEIETSGFGGKMIVEVTVDESSITDIQIKDTFETEGVGKVAIQLIVGDILNEHTTEVEGVTAATISSNVLNALCVKR